MASFDIAELNKEATLDMNFNALLSGHKQLAAYVACAKRRREIDQY